MPIYIVRVYRGGGRGVKPTPTIGKFVVANSENQAMAKVQGGLPKGYVAWSANIKASGKR